MKHQTQGNLKQAGTERQEREQQNERLNPQQPSHEEVSLDNDELNEGRENLKGREELGREQSTERSDRRL
jgi:hypothetical protein